MDYGCVMVFVDFPQIKSLHKIIKEEDIYDNKAKEYGLETEPHVTLLYGLHKEVTKDDVTKAVEGFDLKQTIKIKNLSMFDNPDYDVLKFDVSGVGLSKYNGELKKLPFTSDYDKYHPHLTVGYLKKGTAKKYCEVLKTISYEIEAEKIIFSKADKTKIRII